MAEEKIIIDENPTVTVDPFDSTEFFVPAEKKDEPIIDKKQEPIIDKNDEPIVDKTEPIIEKKDEPVLDGRNFLKERLGYEDWDAAKTEIETLKAKKNAPAEIKYENLDHKQIKELNATIEKKERLDSLTMGEVTKENAPEIIKAAMQEKYKLSADQINYKYNKQFGLPKEPQPKEDDLDGEFEQRKQEWAEKVKDIEMEMLIEASVVRPDLEKIKSEIKLPEINTDTAKKELTPEELEEIKEGRNLFLHDADVELKKFEGFTATYKDKDVEIQSSYKLSDDENKMVMSKIQKFAENRFDANAIFGERWVKDNKFDFNQMAKDLAAIETDERRSQKYLSDAKEKAKIQFIKGKHQIELNTDTGKGELKLEDKTAQQKSEDGVWGLS